MYAMKIFYLNSYFASNVFIVHTSIEKRSYIFLQHILCQRFNVINSINYKNKEIEKFATADHLVINPNIKFNK